MPLRPAPPVGPGPTGLDMLRAFGVIRTDPLRFLDQCARRYGPVVAFPVPGRPVLFVSDPALVRHVLQTNHRAYGKRTAQYDALSLVTGEGLLTSDGEAWRQMRRLVQPAFHHATLDQVVAGVSSAGSAMSQEWDALGATGATFDLDEAMMRTTLRVVGTTLFGADLAAEAGALVAAVVAALDVVVRRAQLPLGPPSWLPTPDNVSLRRSLASLDASVGRLVASRREAGLGDGREDVLGLLLRAVEAGLVTPQQVRNEVVTLIVAGHETVAATLTWTWLLLSQSPQVRARLRHEADDVLGTVQPPDLATVTRLTYSRAVVDEALRLFPPAWVISRRSLADDRLGDIDVPQGSTVFCSPYLLHRDSRVWVRPDDFDPGRFLAGGQEPVARDSYLPFGTGPRLCVGRDLALLEATLLVAMLARRHEVSTAPLAQVVPHPGVTIRPTGGVPATVRHW